MGEGCGLRHSRGRSDTVRRVTGKPRVELTDDVVELWRTTDAVGFLRAWTAGAVDQGQHAAYVGNYLTEVLGPGRVVTSWTPTQQQANLTGGVHGGYLALVCDEAAGMAAASTGERWVPMVTLDLDVTYLRPAQLGKPHRVEGTVLYTGRARIVSEATVLTPDGKVAATARGSFLPNKAFRLD